MKKFISLVVGIFALLIQPVFATSEADLEALVGNADVVACSDQLVAYYDSLDASGVTDDMRAVVTSYYENEFAEAYADANGEDADPDVASKLALLDDKGVYLQYHYLANNEAALGAKDTLADAEDGSAWSGEHASCHADDPEDPEDVSLSTALGDDGSYDYFIIDTSGNIAYTVYKETDLATNLVNGSFAESGLGEAYAGSVASGGLFVGNVASYWPSYEADAQFACAPIGDAGATFCLQITPDQLAEGGALTPTE